LASRVPFAVY